MKMLALSDEEQGVSQDFNQEFENQRSQDVSQDVNQEFENQRIKKIEK